MTWVLAAGIGLTLPLLAVWLVHALDSFRTAKWRLSLVCLAWGALAAYPLAALINGVLIPSIGELGVRVLAAPVIEEALKVVILVYLIRQSQFRYFVDGAIYGFSVGIGFAAVENLIYVTSVGADTALSLALLRALSAALMHAMTSAAAGSALGRLRGAYSTPTLIAGLLSAVVLHMLYNTVITMLSGVAYMAAALSIGITGLLVVMVLISSGLRAEKRRFSETLGLQNDISMGERLAVQGIGDGTVEAILHNLRAGLGDETVQDIRQLLIKQANLGILQHNVTRADVSDRLRTAWQDEITALQVEINTLRRRLGIAVDSYLQAVFPARDQVLWSRMQTELAEYDPTGVHTFDLFMRVSELAGAFTVDQLQMMAQRLSEIDIFRHVPMHELENLSRAIEIVEYADGEMLFDQGDDGDAMYLIDGGAITISILDANGVETALRTFTVGQVVGDFAVVDGHPRSARAWAVGDLRVLVLQREVFHMFIRSRPQVIFSILQVLAERARYTTRSVEAALRSISALAHDEQPVLESVPVPPFTATTEIPAVVPVHEALGRVASRLNQPLRDADE